MYLLLFADDIVLLSPTGMCLQNQINILQKLVNCKYLHLMVNNDKTKVMVFRKGRFFCKERMKSGS
jgi:hypothetical protein